MIFTEADLNRYQESPTACWVLDLQRSRIIWANPAAVIMLRAPTLDDLLKRDLTPRSLSARTRLGVYLERALAGESVSTQWTSMASGAPITFLADLHAWQGPTGNHCLFFEAREVGESMCPEGLRLLESVRHSTAFFSLYTPEGRMLESNPAFTREFGNVFADDSDRFLKLFADNVLNKNTSAGALFRLKAPEKPRQCWRFSLGQFSKPHFPFALSLSKGPCGIRQIKHLA